MAKTITVVIKTCSGCPHIDHTGGFTKGGSKPCCGHNEACETRGFDDNKRLIKNENKIPTWCPL